MYKHLKLSLGKTTPVPANHFPSHAPGPAWRASCVPAPGSSWGAQERQGNEPPATQGRPTPSPASHAGWVEPTPLECSQAGHSPATCSSTRCSRGRRTESCSTVQVTMWGASPSALWTLWKCVTTEWITKLFDCRDTAKDHSPVSYTHLTLPTIRA